MIPRNILLHCARRAAWGEARLEFGFRFEFLLKTKDHIGFVSQNVLGSSQVRNPSGRTRTKGHPTRREDSTAATGIRLTDWRWAFAFSRSGKTQTCHRGLARWPGSRWVLNRVGELVRSKGPVGHHRKLPVNIESTLSPLWGGQSCPQPPFRRPEPAKKPSPEGAPGQDWPPHNWVFIIIGGPQGHEDSLSSCAAVAYRREAG